MLSISLITLFFSWAHVWSHCNFWLQTNGFPDNHLKSKRLRGSEGIKQSKGKQKPNLDTSTAQRSAAQHNKTKYSTTKHSTEQRSTVQHSTAQHSYSTLRHGTVRQIKSKHRKSKQRKQLAQYNIATQHNLISKRTDIILNIHKTDNSEHRIH